MDLSSWLCYKCSGDLELFKRDPYDDPTTVANKLMLALRSLDCRLSFPAQKLRTPYGENVCNVLDFLTEKALAVQAFRWSQPRYADADIVCFSSFSVPLCPYLFVDLSVSPCLSMSASLSLLTYLSDRSKWLKKMWVPLLMTLKTKLMASLRTISISQMTIASR
jgi:hypothetical protein